MDPRPGPPPPPFHPTHQDDRIPAHRKTTGTKVLENRNCWDYKGTHFIHTNWSFERPYESFNCSVQIFLGGEKTQPIDGRSFSSPFGLSQHFFFSSFWHRLSRVFVPLNHRSLFWMETNPCAESSWQLVAPPGAGRSGWKPFLVPPFDRTCVCVFHFKLLSDGYEKRKRKNRDSCGQG